MKESPKYLIIGAGPTGLGAAWRLKELGVEDFLVLERSDHVGGLATSFVDEKGFTWDVGGHVLFSHYDYFDGMMNKVLGPSEWLSHEREAWAWMEGRWVPYPIQSNIRYLSKETMKKCLDGLLAASKAKRAGAHANFKEWLLATFGEGIAEAFLLPYNLKVWAYPLERLSTRWIDDRVAGIDVERILSNIALERDDTSWGPNRTFRFPSRGGTGQIWRNAAELIGASHFRLNCEAREIRHSEKEVVTSDGRVFGCEFLLSTMPLDLLCAALRPSLPADLAACCADLSYSSANIVGLGLKGSPPEAIKKKCWMYFPENDCPFYRVTVFSNYSPLNVPDINKRWSLMAEISESPSKPARQERLVDDTIQGCLNTGLIESPDRIVSVWRRRAEYAYPTPTIARDAALEKLLPALDKLGARSRGRFGAWRYEVGNQDHSAMQGVEWADWATQNRAERTAFGIAPVRSEANKGNSK